MRKSDSGLTLPLRVLIVGVVLLISALILITIFSSGVGDFGSQVSNMISSFSKKILGSFEGIV